MPTAYTRPWLGLAAVKDLERTSSHLLAVLASWLATPGDTIPEGLDAVRQRLQADLASAPDLVFRPWPGGTQGSRASSALLVYFDSLVSSTVLATCLAAAARPGEPAHALTQLLELGEAVDRWSDCLARLLQGQTLLFVAGSQTAISLPTADPPSRALEVAEIEPAARGPQEAFNEATDTRLGQLRRWLPTPGLCIRTLSLGSRISTPVHLVFLKDLANETLVGAVEERLLRVRRDLIERVTDLVPYLYERRWTLFPQVRLTDRVDWVVHELHRGKCAVLLVNDPFAVVLPVTLVDLYQTSQDYSMSFWEATLTRLVRLTATLVSLYLMPLYIALTSVNLDLMPTRLLLTIAGSREGIPFPPVIEVVIMWVIIETLREAANRLPQSLATTLGTVGAVVVGTAIVKAGVVDDIMIVLATLTAVGMFAMPVLDLATTWRWLFWTLVAGAYAFGVLGIVVVTAGLLGYMAGLESFGVPYLAPYAPFHPEVMADSWVRGPATSETRRPPAVSPKDARMGKSAAVEDPLHLSGQMPGPTGP